MYKIVFLALFLFVGCAQYKTTTLILPDGTQIKTQIADTQQKQELGLMYRQNLPDSHGMLFTFEQDEPRAFWMKNTYIPLDIIFIDSDKEITGIAHNVPRSYQETPQDQVAIAPGYGRFVLELPAGKAKKHNLQQGQVLGFNL